MKIRALRMSDVGRFHAPVALEGLTGKLDVLAGPNELGKSTIFRAIEAVFLEKHTVGGKVLEALRPYSGGEPLIEADFETGDGQWRITKRFGRGKGAELVDLREVRTVARGVDAEARLQELIGLRDGQAGGLGLLWVGQRGLLAHVPPDQKPDGKTVKRGERAALLAALESEVEAVAGGGEARAVRERVDATLDALVQRVRKRPKVGSAYDEAVRRRDGLAAELGPARATAELAASRLDELGRLRLRLSEVASPQRGAELRARATEAAATHEAARKARQQLEMAYQVMTARGLEHERVASALAAFDRAFQALTELEPRVSADAAHLSALEVEAAELSLALKAHEAALDRLGAEERLAVDQSLALVRAEAGAAAADQLGQMSRALDVARWAEGEIGHACEMLAANAATAERIGEMEAAERGIALIEARLSSDAPSVRVAFAPGGEGCIKVGGEALKADVELRAAEPLLLEIAGVGTITVSPGAEETRATARKDLERELTRLAAVLQQMGVSDSAEARARHAARRDTERALHQAQATLAGAAPAGIGRLVAEVGRLAAQVVNEPADQDLPERATIEAALADVRQRRKVESEMLAEARRVFEASADALATLKAEAGARRQRAIELEAKLPPPALRTEERLRRANAREAAERAANEARRAFVALEEVAPSQAALAELEVHRDAAAMALRLMQEEAHALERQIERLEGALGELSEAAVDRRLAEIEGELERAQKDVARHEAEIAGLYLLAEVLAEAEKEARDRFLEPVMRGLAPYLGLVFPDARLAFGEDFLLTAFERSGLAEVVGSLSDGTQEQLAILIRLGFGRLFAEAGAPAPLILDDALVYCDDQRMGQMFRALELAAQSHQVLVLTCRSQSFERLQGNRLIITEWCRA